MLKLNGWTLETGKFPNGESWVNVRDQVEIRPNNQIEMVFESNDDLVNLLFLKRFLDEKGTKSRLIAAYMPYSRMDRYNDHYAFSLKYIAGFINSLGFASVTIFEPHSDVTPALIDGVHTYSWVEANLPTIREIIGFDPEQDLLCVPDAGAVKRYAGILTTPYCYGSKERDFKTGGIKGIGLISAAKKARKVLIIDDLCSRGGTFLEMGKRLKEVFGDEVEIYLAVAHCEANIFSGELLKESSPVKHIFTSTSLKRDEHPNITVIE